MTAILAWFRLDLRRRWMSLLVLALLVAFASGVVMTAVAGARRGSTSMDRLLDHTLPATVVVLPNEPGFDWDAVRALPEVEALSGFAVTEFAVDEVPEPGGFPPTDDQMLQTIERPVVLEGRTVDPSRADEVVVSARFQQTYGKEVGDTLTLRLAAPEQIDAAGAGGELDAPAGPVVEATIVGVIRSPWASEQTTEDPGGMLPSPGLFARYAPNLIGAEETAYINALVRLRGGEAAIPGFKQRLAEVTGRSNIDVWDQSEVWDHTRRLTGFEAAGLFAFAAAAGVAAVVLVGQAIARYAASTVDDIRVLSAVGMTPGQSRAVAAAGPTLAAVAGVALGSIAAVVASPRFPIGTASLVEPTPGVDVDALVLGLGVIGVPVLVALGALGAAALAPRAQNPTASSRRSAVAASAARVGAPVPVEVGARFALEAGRGRTAVPVRPALLGAVMGVLGVLAAFTFSSGVSDAANSLERFGQTYQLLSFAGIDSVDFGPVDEMLPVAAADPDVVAVNDARIDVAQVGDLALTLFTIDPVGEPLDIVVTAGELPNEPGEIAVAPNTADATGIDIGDTIEATGTLGARPLTVTGIAFVPESPHNNYAAGGWVTPEGYDSLFDGFKFHFALLELRPGADPGAVATRFVEAGGMPSEPPWPPTAVAELRQVRALPLFLAGFLIVLALGAVGHALATAVRRRRRDLAVLRALGMTRTQSRGVVVTQATVLALVGLAVGVPLGVALGRVVWRYVADTTPVHYLPPVAFWTLVLIAPLALLAANLLAAWPSHRAASMRVGHVLRAE